MRVKLVGIILLLVALFGITRGSSHIGFMIGGGILILPAALLLSPRRTRKVDTLRVRNRSRVKLGVLRP